MDSISGSATLREGTAPGSMVATSGAHFPLLPLAHLKNALPRSGAGAVEQYSTRTADLCDTCHHTQAATRALWAKLMTKWQDRLNGTEALRLVDCLIPVAKR